MRRAHVSRNRESSRHRWVGTKQPISDLELGGTGPLTIGMLSQEKNGRGLSGFGTGLGDGSICPRDDDATANMIDALIAVNIAATDV